MGKTSLYKYLLIGLAVIIAAVVFYNIFSADDYKILDRYSDVSEMGDVNYAFVHVTKNDSTALFAMGKEIMAKEVMPKKDNNPMKRKLLIAYFYDKNELTKIPESMLGKMQKKYEYNEMIKKNMTYMANGYIFTGLFDGLHKKYSYSMQKTVILVPKNGIKAKDIIKSSNPKREM